MMQGITTLPGAQQGNQQAPGQAAQFQAMPAKQGGIAPPITAPLEKLPPQQLLTMYNNPQDTTPKWAVATAYAKAVEQARLMQMAQGQSAMAQNQAQSQQPPVAQQVMMQPVPETQFARHGGIMHGYAGGGAVAFNQGGNPRVEQYRQQLENYLQERMRLQAATKSGDPQAASLYAQKLQALRGEIEPGLRRAAAYETSESEAPAYVERLFNEGLPTAPPVAASAAPAAPTSPAPTPTKSAIDPAVAGIMERNYRPRRNPVAAPALPSAGPAGIAAALKTQGFPSPVESPALRKALDEQNKLARDQAKITEDERAARGGIDALSKQIIEEKRAEEARRLAQSESRYSEAKGRAERNPLSDMAYLGRMIGEARGAKRTGELLAGWASGAGKAQGEREEALRKAEEKYDLSRNEISNLANLRQQAELDQARLIETRASGDANRIRAAEAQAAASGVKLAEYEQTLGIKGREFDLEQMKIDAQRAATAASSAQANQQRLMGIISSTEARKQELIRKITDDYKDSKKMTYAMASVPNADKGALEAKAAADRELAGIIRERTAELDKILAQTAVQIPGFGGVYQNTALPPGVTVKKTGA